MALSDAHYFLTQVSSLPRTLSAVERKNRFMTAVVFLSWVGLEAAVVDELRRCRNAGLGSEPPNRRLRDRVAFLLQAKNQPFDQAAFDRLRRVRNELAHPSGFGGHAPDSALASETFEYCLGIVRAFYPYQIHL
jgi:hypothetical protein